MAANSITEVLRGQVRGGIPLPSLSLTGTNSSPLSLQEEDIEYYDSKADTEYVSTVSVASLAQPWPSAEPLASLSQHCSGGHGTAFVTASVTRFCSEQQAPGVQPCPPS